MTSLFMCNCNGRYFLLVASLLEHYLFAHWYQVEVSSPLFTVEGAILDFVGCLLQDN